MSWSLVTCVLLQHRKKGTCVLYHTGVDICIDCEPEKKLAKPDLDVIHP
jgi:hypothetical protein